MNGWSRSLIKKTHQKTNTIGNFRQRFLIVCIKVAWLNNAVPSQSAGMSLSAFHKQELIESLTPRCIQTSGNKKNRQMNRQWHWGVPPGFYKWLFRWLLVVAYVCCAFNESLWKRHKLNKYWNCSLALITESLRRLTLTLDNVLAAAAFGMRLLNVGSKRHW